MHVCESMRRNWLEALSSRSGQKRAPGCSCASPQVCTQSPPALQSMSLSQSLTWPGDVVSAVRLEEEKSQRGEGDGRTVLIPRKTSHLLFKLTHLA